MGYHKRLSPLEAEKLGFEVKPKTDTKHPQYYFNNSIIRRLHLPSTATDTAWKTVFKNSSTTHTEVLNEYVKNDTLPNDYNMDKPFVMSAWDYEKGQTLNIDQFCEKYNMPREDVTSYKFLPYHYSEPTYHIVFKDTFEKQIEEIDFEAIIKKHITPYHFKPKKKDTGVFLFDRAVYTDVHTGMNTNENGYSLYGGKWDEDEINNRKQILIKHILENQKGDTLFIDDLGDFADGYDGETVRKGHSLPQNMDNEKQFDVGLNFKIGLIEAIAPHYSKIICNNICDDNHAGSFGYIINSAFKRFIEYRYTHIIVNNIRKFIDHYFYGKNCFIITHGKDGKNLKFGFKPVLDTKQIEKIDNYIKEHKLYDYIIEFSKGDSHQKIFDESTSDTFDYYNYPAFSPSSNWVQTNFKIGFSGFEFFNFKEDGSKIHCPYKFTWNTNRTGENIDYSH